MTANLSFPLEFTLPPGWRTPLPPEAESAAGTVVAVRPERAATITSAGELRPDGAGLPEVADEAITTLRESGSRVDVLSRTEVGTPDSPGLAQILLLGGAAASIEEVVQCQAFLAMPDVGGSGVRAVLRFVMTTTRQHIGALVGDFQQFLGTVRLNTAVAEGKTKEEP
ncbi:hypothetical protein [Amycolatopsis sp. 195334CR]|uniref:hypothetical protein n=1 Tax=Amycolatopsis sp. 195334CR TaxID=2814588 RepID=UPI001A8ECEAA|nr:hypothetical protein [Amycolatopsis sp. 195334CR]MBN6039089.1 hypothetical protein [Amycolatopsis sp. 195334CR]